MHCEQAFLALMDNLAGTVGCDRKQLWTEELTAPPHSMPTRIVHYQTQRGMEVGQWVVYWTGRAWRVSKWVENVSMLAMAIMAAEDTADQE